MPYVQKTGSDGKRYWQWEPEPLDGSGSSLASNGGGSKNDAGGKGKSFGAFLDKGLGFVLSLFGKGNSSSNDAAIAYAQAQQQQTTMIIIAAGVGILAIVLLVKLKK